MGASNYIYLLRKHYLDSEGKNIQSDMNNLVQEYVINKLNSSTPIDTSDLKRIQNIISSFRDKSNSNYNDTEENKIIDRYTSLFKDAISNKISVNGNNFLIDAMNLSIQKNSNYSTVSAIKLNNIASSSIKDKTVRGIEHKKLENFSNHLEKIKSLTAKGGISEEDFKYMKNIVNILLKEVEILKSSGQDFSLAQSSIKAQDLSKINKIIDRYYKTPPLNLYKGKFAEGLFQLAMTDLSGLSLNQLDDELNKIIGKIINEDKIERVEYKKNIASVKNNSAKVNIEESIYKQYGKIDVEINWNSSANFGGASVKNYNLSNPNKFLKFHTGNFAHIIGDLGERFNTHFLNTYAYMKSEKNKNIKSFENAYEGSDVRMSVYIATKKILLYRAIAGYGGEELARLLIINDSSKANSFRVLDIVSTIKDIMMKTDNEISKNISVKLYTEGSEKALTKNLYQLYTMQKMTDSKDRVEDIFNKYQQTLLKVTASNNLFKTSVQ